VHYHFLDEEQRDALRERQVKLEQEVIDGGIEKFRTSISKSVERGYYSDTLPGTWLVRHFIDPVAQRIRADVVEVMEGKPGRQNVAVGILARLMPDQSAFITVRSVVNALVINVTKEEGLEKILILEKIAWTLRNELLHEYMHRTKPRAYDFWTKQLKTIPRSKGLIRRKLVARLKRLYPNLKKQGGITRKESLIAAEWLFQVFREETKLILMHTTLDWKALRANSKKTVRFKKVTVQFSPLYKALLNKLENKAEALWPEYPPMVCPPEPWTDTFHGGFVGPLGERTELIRGGNRNFLEELDARSEQLEKVFKALNGIQDTAWRVNKRVLGVLREVFRSTRHLSENYALPASEPLDKREVPDSIPEKDRPAFYRTRDKLEAQRYSKFLMTENILSTAQKYADEVAIWFAHNLDWRGRIYPMTSFLSPQGEELSRALLEFAQGLPVADREAADWLAIHGANCYGIDKVSYEERVGWVRDHEQEIRASASDPIGYNGFWTRADKPWMFLAWCFEWVGYLAEGFSFVSSIPVAMDGSCNGLQNFAAMLRCPVTAKAVNLMPSDKPNDIYQQVADSVIPKVTSLALSNPMDTESLYEKAELRQRVFYEDAERIEKETIAIGLRVDSGELTEEEGDELLERLVPVVDEREEQELREMWRVLAARWMQGHIDRKLVKRPVMTYPYSVTVLGIRNQIQETLEENLAKGSLKFPDKCVGRVASMLKDVILEAIQEVVVAASSAMRWLKSAAKVVAKNNLPVSWVSPIGLPVVQHYWEITAQQVQTYVGSIRYQTKVYENKEGEVGIHKQLLGVSPNFVHSMDASHLMFTVLGCLGEGITDFHMIHDSYGTHASNAGKLAKVLREQFVKLYDGDVLACFRDQLCSQMGEKVACEIPLSPKQNDFDVTIVNTSSYFFS
jgi:DNA-directed RNA polymerase